MPRTLMPTPEDPESRAASSPPGDLLDPEAQAVLDFLRGEYVSARGAASSVQPGTACARPAKPEPADCDLTKQDRLVYLPVLKIARKDNHRDP
jgi:hypothetical protein